MPRLKTLRMLAELPIIKGFRPIWIKANYRQAVIMNLEEYEAIRLTDYENLIHEQAAEAMNVSRPTFTRIYETARKKVAAALTEGRSLLIEGGNVELNEAHYYCESCNQKFTKAVGNEMRDIVCPNCNSKQILSLNDCFVKGCRRCRRCR